MSANNYKPHFLVIPEDYANVQLANGFKLGVTHQRQIQILREAGGWNSVCDRFRAEIPGMYQNRHRYMVLLLDFDDQAGRRAEVMRIVPDDLRDRVFLLGVRSEPEALKRAGLRPLEDIGTRLATECRDRRREIWMHELLCENADELTRLDRAVSNFLFST